MSRGRLIVLEGAEGVGKTTQVARLADRLSSAGVRVERYREPGGTPLGDDIRSLLLDPNTREIAAAAEALLFMAARAQLMDRVQSRLSNGTSVLLDRFFLSTYAYQIVGRGLDERHVREANQLAVRGMKPDITLLLVSDLDVAQARVRARGDLDRMEQEGKTFHERVTAAFLAAADPAWQLAHPEIGPVARVDAGGSVDEVGARIEHVLYTRWPETFSGLRESH